MVRKLFPHGTGEQDCAILSWLQLCLLGGWARDPAHGPLLRLRHAPGAARALGSLSNFLILRCPISQRAEHLRIQVKALKLGRSSELRRAPPLLYIPMLQPEVWGPLQGAFFGDDGVMVVLMVRLQRC